MLTLSQVIQSFVVAKSRKGEQCAECSTIFARDKGDGKVVVTFRNTGGGISIYILCAVCGAGYKKAAKRAIPNVVKDAYIAAAMSPYAYKGEFSCFSKTWQ